MQRTPIEWRQFLFEENQERLIVLADRQITRGRRPSDFLIVCIDVEDHAWRELVDHLMPGQDWQSIRDRGENPVARGAVLPELCDLLSRRCPDVTPALEMQIAPNQIRVAVMGGGGVSVYIIEIIARSATTNVSMN